LNKKIKGKKKKHQTFLKRQNTFFSRKMAFFNLLLLL